jgi:uncharacterized protein YjiS (DUF1127 family)
MASSQNHIDAEITFHQPWARGIEWVANQHTRFQLLRNEWRKRRNYRADLRRLLATGPHLIPDIGLKTEESIREASKPFWVG